MTTHDIRVSLKAKDERYQVACGTLIFASESTAQELNQLIKHLGSFSNDGSELKDFVFRHETTKKILTTTINELSLDAGMTKEDLLVLNYELPGSLPEKAATLEEPDWIRAVSLRPSAVRRAGLNGRTMNILSASYDRSVRLYSIGEDERVPTQLSTFTGFPDAPSAVAWLDDGVFVVGCSNGDIYLRDISRDTPLPGNGVKLSGNCSGSAIQKIIITGRGEYIISADYGGHVSLFSTCKVLEAAAAAATAVRGGSGANKKKIKGMRGWFGKKTGPPDHIVQSEVKWQAHVEPISLLQMSPSTDRLVTGGWDGSLKEWQLPDGILIKSWSLHESITTAAILDNPEFAGCLIATGHSDGSIKVSSSSSLQLVASRREAHQGWITSLTWDPNHQNRLLSCGHDGRVFLWDTSDMTMPVKELASSTKKVLTSDWKDDILVFGGEEKILDVYKI